MKIFPKRLKLTFDFDSMSAQDALSILARKIQILRETEGLQSRKKNKRVFFCTGVTDGSRQFADIADDLEAVKAEMDERGSSMTDGTPLVNIRKSLARMKQEVVTMDVRVGVVQHTLLQAKSL